MTARGRPRDLLRAPPFPGVPAAIAAVVSDRDGVGAASAPEMARATAAALAAARVGGCFWGRQVAGRPRLVVLGREEALPDAGLDGAAVVVPRDRRVGGIPANAMLIPDDVDPWPLIDAAEVIHAAADAEIGVLALAAGKQVFGPDGEPWNDEGGAVFDRWLLAGRRYRDPVSGEEIDALTAVAILTEWRRLIDANRAIAAAAGMAFWKRREVGRLLWAGSGPVRFRRPAQAIAAAARAGGGVAAWPSRVPADFAEQAAAAGVPLNWVEDGFLRSAGLGSDLTPPLSIIVDTLRPYFDPSGPSALEHILEQDELGPALSVRAAALRAAIVAGGIGKYGSGGQPTPLSASPDKRVVLVIGQVEDDLSVRRGGGDVTGNLDLLTRARRAEPDAFIVFRPHPDVEAGHRKGAIPDPVALRLADQVVRGGSLDALLARVDRVHVLTSLTGFEALLRGREVVVHGGPFYAGWGLTDDRGPPLPRRTRRLTLDQLVAGALILYPRYLDPEHGLPCTPEAFIRGMKRKGSRANWLVRIRRWQGRLRRSMRG